MPRHSNEGQRVVSTLAFHPARICWLAILCISSVTVGLPFSTSAEQGSPILHETTFVIAPFIKRGAVQLACLAPTETIVTLSARAIDGREIADSETIAETKGANTTFEHTYTIKGRAPWTIAVISSSRIVCTAHGVSPDRSVGPLVVPEPLRSTGYVAIPEASTGRRSLVIYNGAEAGTSVDAQLITANGAKVGWKRTIHLGPKAVSNLRIPTSARGSLVAIVAQPDATQISALSLVQSKNGNTKRIELYSYASELISTGRVVVNEVTRRLSSLLLVNPSSEQLVANITVDGGGSREIRLASRQTIPITTRTRGSHSITFSKPAFAVNIFRSTATLTVFPKALPVRELSTTSGSSGGALPNSKSTGWRTVTAYVGEESELMQLSADGSTPKLLFRPHGLDDEQSWRLSNTRGSRSIGRVKSGPSISSQLPSAIRFMDVKGSAVLAIKWPNLFELRYFSPLPSAPPGPVATNSPGETPIATVAPGSTATPTPIQTPNPTPTPTPNNDPNRHVIGREDLIYEGTYDAGGGDINYGSGLTHRYVNGELRLMFLAFMGNNNPPNSFLPMEVALPASFGQSVIVRRSPGYWTEIWDPAKWRGNDSHTSIVLHGDDLFINSALDYPQGTVPTTTTGVLTICKLNPLGGPCLERHGSYGIAGVGQRAAFGPTRKIPTWFRNMFGTGEYIILGGGYSSLMAQGLGPSMGPFFLALQEPRGRYTPQVFKWDPPNIPSSDVKIGADMRPASSTDWYGVGYANRTHDRGVRINPVTNYFDGGDPRNNPPTPPNFPPVAGAQWLSPAPGDPRGLGRWTWGDSYRSGSTWIDNESGTRRRHGIVAVASVGTGKAYYMSSAGYTDGGAAEVHVYDPNDVGNAMNGLKNPRLIEPKSVFALTEINSYIERAGNLAATFDPVSNKLFIMTYFGTGARCYLHQYRVRTGDEL